MENWDSAAQGSKHIFGFRRIPRHSRDPRPAALRRSRLQTQALTLRGARLRNERARARSTRRPAPPRARTHAWTFAGTGWFSKPLAVGSRAGHTEREQLRAGCYTGTASHFPALTSSVKRRRGLTFPWVTPWRAGRGGPWGSDPSEQSGGARARPLPPARRGGQ